MDHTDRSFIYNPLHDYESILWMAVWFIFHCKFEGAADDVLNNARAGVYKNRSFTITGNLF